MAVAGGQSQVQRGSATCEAGRAAARRLNGRFHRAHKRAHEFPVHLRRNGISIDPCLCQKLACVVHAIDARWLDFDRLETRAGKLCAVFALLECARDAADPKFDALANCRRHLAPDNHIGNCKSPAGFQHPKRLFEHAILVRRKIDDAV